MPICFCRLSCLLLQSSSYFHCFLLVQLLDLMHIFSYDILFVHHYYHRSVIAPLYTSFFLLFDKMDSSLGPELDDSHHTRYLCSTNEIISHLCGSALITFDLHFIHTRHSCCLASACPFSSLCSSCGLVDYPNHKYQPF